MRVVIADIKGRGGFVNKDTVVGGYGSRFRGFSWTTRWIERARKLFQNVPSIHAGYLAAIFEQAGHSVRVTRDEFVDGDIALILSSLVDYRHEIEWAKEAKRRYGMRVGFFGAPATHMPELLENHADFLIKGEPEQAAIRIAAGEIPAGTMASPAIDNLDSLAFPAWHLFDQGHVRHAVGRSFRPSNHVFPVLSSRSCPEFCTYCPHRITAPYRSRSAENVVAEIEEICARHEHPYLIFRDPLFSEERERSTAIAQGILRKKLKVRFECETRLDDLDKDLLDLLHRAGLNTVTFGVESVDPTTLKRVGRRPIPPEHQRSIVSYCRDKGITTEGFFVIGFLTDSVESIRATIDYAIDLNPTAALFKILTPFPGTPLFKHMKPLITETDWEKFDGYTPTFRHPNLSHKELLHLLGLAYTRFYVRPSFGLNYFGIKTPIETLDALMHLEAYAKRRQLEADLAFFEGQASKAGDQ
jgi:anaerobic magnesium-protoporphyrin IX monomethyl ester cyclase